MIDQNFFILIFGMILTFTLVLIIYGRYELKSRRMDLIEKGLWKPEYEDKNENIVFLEGLILMAIGASILTGWKISKDINMYLRMIIGLIPLSVGLSLLTYFFLSKLFFKSKK